jgi:hypothetical protein
MCGFRSVTENNIQEVQSISCSPSGWDNMKKISILYENLQSMKPDDYYRDVIVQPVLRKVSQSVVWTEI